MSKSEKNFVSFLCNTAFLTIFQIVIEIIRLRDSEPELSLNSGPGPVPLGSVSSTLI
jgi:hypothetical protein